ncbi:MAG: PQQ-binding-like beta-propeller repeat protein [Ignavibacteria bacterium]|nr:PQQ-binding-like beta-propeller repeat protein [Ignavibacteria bacterium]
MKKLVIILIVILSVKINFAQGNSWVTVGGNNNRSSYINTFFDAYVGFNASFNAPYSIWGMPVFTNRAHFATTRYTSLSPLRAMVTAFTYFNSNPVWTYGETSGVNIIMGFNDDKIYVRDFQQNGSDTIFALNSFNGAMLWKSRFTVERGIIWTAVFADNGDLILPGSGSKRIMRINHVNGDTVWTNSRIIPNTGAETMCINGNTLYAWEGSITTPKKITAIDVNNGITKYSSPELPGDGDQEIPFSVSSNGVVYCIRDGGLMYAIKDNGTSLSILWSRNVLHPVGTYTQIAIGKDSTVYIPFGKKIYRLDHVTGAVMDSSVDLVSAGTINPRFATGISQVIFIGNGAENPSEGKFFSFSRDLQTLNWEISSPYNYYCGPAVGSTSDFPFLLMTGNGNEIKAKYGLIENINSISTEVPGKFKLSQNYPNPFNPVTNLEFGISDLGFVTLKIYDILGNEMETLVDEQMNPGTYSVQFDGSKYSSGIYFYRLSASGFTETRKMNLIK